jgi:predicted AAA+ superfamily ATPase
MDLLVVKGRKKIGFEVKLTSSPRVTPSMRSALSDLKLQCLYVIHSGEETFQLARNIQAIALPRLIKDLKPLK